MKIIEWPRFLETSLPLDEKMSTAITVGVFDGVHRGHKTLIQQVVQRKENAVPMVVTFKRSSYKKAGSGQEYIGDILSFRQKMAFFERLGVSITVVIEFSDAFRRTSGADFLHILKKQGKMSFLSVGSNFRCGYQLDTDVQAIKDFNTRYNIPTVIVPILTEGSVQISSSHIRTAIARGDLKTAQAMLGYPFTVDLTGGGAGESGDSATNAFTCAISSRGCILPPPGRYAVNLLGEKAGQPVKIQTEICVDGGNIIITRNTATENAFLEYAEFLPDGAG